jgi:branched-chain amino acid transport system substrate-binding protein
MTARWKSGIRTVVRSRPVLRISIFSLVCLLATSLGPRAAGPIPANTNEAQAASARTSALPSRAPTPFFRLRDATLAYNGPEDDITNLTDVRIGWFGPHDATNHLAADMWWAANLAVQEANARTLDYNHLPFRLVPCWTADPWGSGISQLTRMLYEEQPLALLGSVDSASTHLAEQVVAKANLPLVSPVATDKSATLAGVSWMFACAPSDEAVARLLVDAVLDGLSKPADKFVLLSATEHESRMTTREVIREFSRRSRMPDYRFDVQSGAADLTREMQALAEAKPAAVLVIAGPEDAARLVLAIREQAPAAAIFGGPSMGHARFLELAGRAAEGVRFPLLFLPDHADANTTRFVACFQAVHRRPPDYTAGLTYDATRLLIEAIRGAGPNRARIREALTRLSPWPGIAGPITFDGTGQNSRKLNQMGTIKNGCIVPDSLPGEGKVSN